jgi:hypothetical protein
MKFLVVMMMRMTCPILNILKTSHTIIVTVLAHGYPSHIFLSLMERTPSGGRKIVKNTSSCI